MVIKNNSMRGLEMFSTALYGRQGKIRNYSFKKCKNKQIILSKSVRITGVSPAAPILGSVIKFNHRNRRSRMACACDEIGRAHV